MAFDAKTFITEERAKRAGGDKNALSDEAIYNQIVEQSTELREKVERGFFGEILPTAGQMIGGTAGLFLGGPKGAIGGAAILGGLGETAQQGIEIATGQRKHLDPAQITAAGFTGAVLEPVGMAVSGIGGKLLSKGKEFIEPGISKIRAPIAKFLAKMSGFTDEMVHGLLSRAPGVKAGLEEGEKALEKVIVSARDKLGKLKGFVTDNFGKELDNVIKNESLGGPGEEASRAINLKEVGKFKLSAAQELRNHNIGVDKDGTLMFQRTHAPSRITSVAEQKNIQEAFDLLTSIEKDTSTKHVEAVLERIRALKKFESTTGAQTSSIVESIFSHAEDVATKLYPDLAEIRAKYGLQRELINDAEDLLGRKTLDAGEKKRIITKLQQLYNQGGQPVREAAEVTGEVLGEDIIGTTLGSILKGKVEAPSKNIPLTITSAFNRFLGSIPAKVVQEYVKTGKLGANVLVDNKFVQTFGTILQQAARGGSREAINLLEGKTTE